MTDPITAASIAAQNVFGGEANQVNNPTAPVILGQHNIVNISY